MSERKNQGGSLCFAIGLVIVVAHFLFLPVNNSIDGLSTISEVFIVALLASILFNLHRVHGIKQLYDFMYAGFLLLFISSLTDALDEIFTQPKIVTTIFEDLFDLSGFLVIYLGIHHWLVFNEQQSNKLANLAKLDSLTGLAVRRYLLLKAQIEFDLFTREKKPVSVLMLDVDNFKAINTNYGHTGGDDALVALAKTMKESVRHSDFIGRWGGEEFVIVLADCSFDKALVIAESVRENIESMQVITNGIPFNLTASIGVAQAETTDESIEKLIERADNCMFKAKRLGKNRVCSEG